MSYSPITSKLFQFTALSLALTLAGCGGGDGVDSIAPKPDLGVKPQPEAGDGVGTPVDAVNITDIVLTDTSGNMTRIITSSGASAKVTVTDNAGVPISNAIVSFAGESVAFGTSNGSVLTNERGEASISVKPLDGADTGSYQLTATTTYNEMTATTAAYNFTLQAINVVLANLALSSSSIQAGASTNITLKTKDATTNAFQNDIEVGFSTTCGTFDSDSVVSSNQGDVTATYKAISKAGNLCEGTQTITATPASGAAGQQSVTVNIAAIKPSSVVYTTSGNVQLGARNSGSSSSGQIEFTIYANGTPAANQQVDISKIYAPTDFSFISLNNQATKTVTSDSQGKVVVTLYPGALPGPVEIKATLKADPTIFALSKDVSVATGRATQDGVSISLSKNVLAYGVDGDTASITTRLVDRVGNPVPNGTVVSFVSEGGRVTPNCATVNGVCTVEFSTQNPRPADNRVSVIVYVEGDKSYTDVDGDNQFSVGDILTHNIGDFFRDDNEDNLYNAANGEFVYRRGVTGPNCKPSSFSQPNMLGTCDDKLTATLRYQFVLGLADDTPTFSGLPSSLTAPAGTSGIFKMYGNSTKTVSMASGTTINVTAEDKTNYTPTATLATNGDITVINGEPNSTVVVTSGATPYSVTLNGSGTGTKTTGLPDGSALTVVYENTTCEAEITAGNLTVPSLVNLQGGTGVVSIADVSYAFSYSKCASGDKVKVTVQTPAPAATKTTTTISVI